jgi:type IV pilus assembly protein PilV
MCIYRNTTHGFTLLEMMIAMLILMVGLLSMLTVVNLAIQTNAKNKLRELAVAVGEDQMRTLLATPIDTLRAVPYTDPGPARVCKPFLGYSAGFTITRKSTPQGNSSAELEVTVNWVQKGENHQHQLNTVKTR